MTFFPSLLSRRRLIETVRSALAAAPQVPPTVRLTAEGRTANAIPAPHRRRLGRGRPRTGPTAIAWTASPANVRPVTVPEFGADRGLQWSSTLAEYEVARGDEDFVFEELSYESDGLVVGAYLYRPKPLDGQRLPVIVHNRGGFVRPVVSLGRCW